MKRKNYVHFGIVMTNENIIRKYFNREFQLFYHLMTVYIGMKIKCKIGSHPFQVFPANIQTRHTQISLQKNNKL